MLKEFLENEDGFLGFVLPFLAKTGLGAAAASALGTTTTALGGLGHALGSSLDAKSKHKKATAAHRDRFVNFVEDTKRAGLNPYFMANSGLAAQSAPRLMSTAAETQTFDQIDAILTGQAAADRKSQELRDELMRIDIDQARRGRLGHAGPAAGPAAGNGVIGDTPHPDELEPGRNVVTAAQNTDAEWFTNPRRQDVQMWNDRYGDSEIAQTGLAVWASLDDAAYNERLQYLSEQTGKTKAEIHAEIASDPMAYEGKGKFIQRVLNPVNKPKLMTPGLGSAGDFNQFDPTGGYPMMGGATR
jgi:hypothetical protein